MLRSEDDVTKDQLKWTLALADKNIQGSWKTFKTWKITNSFSRSWKGLGILQNQEISWKNIACENKST